MNVNINIKRKFKVNGKEYNSVDEMPPDIRNTWEKAMADQSNKISISSQQTKIIFNGTEYQSIDAMPQDVRQLYEKVLKAAETGTAPANIITAGDISGIPAGQNNYETTSMGDIGKSTKINPTGFSPRMFVRGIILIIIIVFLYYFVLHGK